MISLEKSMILAPLLKLPKNVGDLGKFIVAKSFKSCPKCKKSPTLVTLVADRKGKLKRFERRTKDPRKRSKLKVFKIENAVFAALKL